MKSVNQMSNSEIMESIDVMRNGLGLNPGEREKAILLKNIARAESELEKRKEIKNNRETQKKSDPQLTGKAGQLPQEKPDPMYQPTTEKEKEEAKYQKFMEQKIQEKQPGLLEQVINLIAPPSAPEQIIEIEIDGQIESYSLEELRDKARTWFTQTAEGAAIQKGKGKLEKSVQYRRLCAVVPNWEQFYGHKPKVQDLHRRHNLHGEAVKSAAVRLLQILTS